ncbi:hypothetical protein B9Z55_016829 [Caenorhabditis nigoni]|uniref:T20D4.11-like domain-containing protein n=1 Tax=Caenorhabditis nigoni TaxID=1611254 RepID=A0A2G5T6S4_9PELO|nr:hypothetical protein B9Z55_016829 [Caenorhabditis nigoni]
MKLLLALLVGSVAAIGLDYDNIVLESSPGVNMFREYKPRCTKRHEMYIDMTCLQMFGNFSMEIKKTAKTMEPFIAFEHKKTCNDIKRCFFPLSCSPIDDVKKAARTLQLYCGLYNYRASDFFACGTKLTLAKSQCHHNWDPYPSALEKEENLARKAALVQQSCDNIFGEDNCMEHDVTVVCGEKKWIDLRDRLIELNPIMNNCSLVDNPIFQAIPTTTEKPWLHDLGDPFADE